MAPSKQDDLQGLLQLIGSTQALLSQFALSLAPSSTAAESAPATIPNPPNPLEIVRDAAQLLKAHTTKISLLAINKPFTPAAITKILRELSGTCLPALMSATQIGQQEKATWGSFMSTEINARVRRVFREVEALVAEVRAVAEGRDAAAAKRDNLNATGKVWEACDALIELQRLGIAGLAVQKAEQYRDTIKDAISELQEWREGGDDDLEDEDDKDDDAQSDADSIEDIFEAANSIPKDRAELRQLVESAEARLKKVVLLYTALIKRRLKTFKKSTTAKPDSESESSNTERLDQAMGHLKEVPELIDELASVLYDLDEDQAKTALENCIDEARKASRCVVRDWTHHEDEFTAWTEKWEQAVG